jgi:hypothetical protein
MSRLVPDQRQGRKVDGTNVRVVHESAPGGMRKLRGPNHQLAVPTRQRDGSSVLQSPDGTVYRSKPMK